MEAFVLVSKEKGKPIPLASSMIIDPMSRMNILGNAELKKKPINLGQLVEAEYQVLE